MKKRIGWNKGLTKETDERIAKMALSVAGRVRTPEHCLNLSKARKGKTTWMKGKYHTEEAKEKNRQAHLGKSPFPNGRNITWGDKISQAILKKCQDPEYAQWLVSRINVRARDVKPNKCELLLRSILDRHFPNEWKYVGDGEMALGRKIPDFVNVNGKKQIIELYGHYWHKGQDPQERIDEFKQFGFDTIVIWEDELKDEKAIVARVKDFLSVEIGHEASLLG